MLEVRTWKGKSGDGFQNSIRSWGDRGWGCSSVGEPLSHEESGISQDLKVGERLVCLGHLRCLYYSESAQEEEWVSQCSAGSVEADMGECKALHLVSRIHRPGRDGMQNKSAREAWMPG